MKRKVRIAARVSCLPVSVKAPLAIWRSRLAAMVFRAFSSCCGWVSIETDAESLLRKNMGNAIAHGTGADHGDILHGGALLGGGSIIVSEVTPLPGLDKFGPGERVEDVLGWRLSLVIVFLGALSQIGAGRLGGVGGRPLARTARLAALLFWRAISISSSGTGVLTKSRSNCSRVGRALMMVAGRYWASMTINWIILMLIAAKVIGIL